MIILLLIHPTKPIPVNRWTFKDKSVIRIGRAKDNDVVIYNAVVSRHHLELWERGSGWEVMNLGTNGTYINKKPIDKSFIQDGMVISLGSSGPRLMVKFNLASAPQNLTIDSLKRSISSPALNLDELTEVEDLEDNDEDHSVTRIEF